MVNKEPSEICVLCQALPAHHQPRGARAYKSGVRAYKRLGPLAFPFLTLFFYVWIILAPLTYLCINLMHKKKNGDSRIRLTYA